MHEHPSNIGFRCEKHALSPNPIYKDIPLRDFIDKYCKLAFSIDKEKNEYMWVEVDGLAVIEGEELSGLLRNDPIYIPHLQCGDRIEFSRNEILELLDLRNK